MTLSLLNKRHALRVALLAGSLLLGCGSVLPALAHAQDIFPEVRMSYGDLPLDTAAGRRTLVERVDATAAAHCTRYGALIVPRDRQGQRHYCAYAVRGDILRALPRPVRAAYDRGRRASDSQG